MKFRDLRVFLSITSALLLALVVVYTARAYLLCKPPIGIGGTNYRVQSCKDAFLYNASSWKGRMVSRVRSGGNIAKLGWHSWTDTSYCNFVPWQIWDYGPSYGYNRTYWASTSASHPLTFCAQTYGRVCGNHYWETNTNKRVTQFWCHWGGPWP